jgi:hypothetical protein
MLLPLARRSVRSSPKEHMIESSSLSFVSFCMFLFFFFARWRSTFPIM